MLEVIARVFFTFVVICYFCYLLPTRFRNKLVLAIPAFVYLIGTAISYNLIGNSTINFITNFAAILFFLCFFKNPEAGIFYCLIMEVMMLFSDGFLYYIVKMICNLRGIILEDIPNHKLNLYIAAYVLWLVLAYLCVRKFRALQQYDIPKLYWLCFSTIPVCSIYLLFHLYTVYVPDTIMTVGNILAIFVIAAMNIVNIHLYSAAIRYYATKLENQTLMERVHLSTQKQSSLVDAYKNIQIIRHNIKNDLVPILTAIGEKQYEVAEDKLREIIGEADRDIFVSNTGVNFIDDMIDYKASIARENNIVFNVVSKLDEIFKLNYLDISSIIGTALDNAIDACLQVVEHRVVDICVTSRAGLFMFRISNPRNSGILPDEAGGLQSTKQDGAEHGFGLVSIKKLVEKNRGQLRIEYPEGRFDISVVFLKMS